ncbi:hypothetical protein P4S57_13935 [Pseudoalteromonas sp. Hal273]
MNIYDNRLSFQEQLEQCKKNLDRLSDNAFVSLEVAQNFIQESVWWNHPKSGWVRAPRHSRNIERGSRGWEIHFGANKFCISLAITRCVSVLHTLITKFSENNEYPREELLKKLYFQVRCSICNYNGDLYKAPYKLNGNDMIFGTTSIDIKDFVDEVILRSKIMRLYNYKIANKPSNNLNTLIKHQLATFKSLSTKFSESEGNPVMYEYEAWSSQDYFALLGELKTNLDENEQQFSDIDYLYEKYKSHIPLR